MLRKLEGEKFSQRHLTPENLNKLKTTLNDQLEVIHTSKRAKIVNNLTWPEPQAEFVPIVQVKTDQLES